MKAMLLTVPVALMLLIGGCGPDRELKESETQPISEQQKQKQQSYEEAMKEQNKKYQTNQK